eukprot:9491974-Pyramimonas_sp.AAC.2
MVCLYCHSDVALIDGVDFSECSRAFGRPGDSNIYRFKLSTRKPTENFIATARINFVEQAPYERQPRSPGAYSLLAWKNRVKNIIGQLLEAVKYIHSQNIIHRDLKLDNILYCNTGSDEIKVADFGVCFPKTEFRAHPETRVSDPVVQSSNYFFFS